jgi:hypothetical protein
MRTYVRIANREERHRAALREPHETPGGEAMATYTTTFGSLDDYEKGGVEVINDDPRPTSSRTCSRSRATPKPYEKVAVAKNMEYVLETIRAEGTSRVAGHPARRVRARHRRHRRVELLDPTDPRRPRCGRLDRVDGEPDGTRMGRSRRRAGTGVAAAGRCYRFHCRRRRRDPPPDHRRPRHPLPLGRDLPDRSLTTPHHQETHHDRHSHRRPAPNPNEHGYNTFSIGGFTFTRDEHFANIEWPTGTPVIVDRDVPARRSA